MQPDILVKEEFKEHDEQKEEYRVDNSNVNINSGVYQNTPSQVIPQPTQVITQPRIPIQTQYTNYPQQRIINQPVNQQMQSVNQTNSQNQQVNYQQPRIIQGNQINQSIKNTQQNMVNQQQMMSTGQ